MSGPIVRKYGFPNFDQIFGKRELEHGVDEDEPAKEESKTEITASGAPAPAQPPAKPGKRSPGKSK
jgi:hypothetical protein